MLISIYLPTKNRIDLLSRAINSVRAQTYPYWELVVVDDGSTDGTANYLQQVASDEPRIKVLRNEASLGGCASRNLAITHARGELVTGLDDDDFILASHLSTLLDCFMASTPSGAPHAAYAGMRVLSGNQIRERRHFRATVTAKDLLVRNYIGNQVFALRSSYLEAGLFDAQMPAWQDYEFWYRLAGVVGSFRYTGHSTYVHDVTSDSQRISNQHPEKIWLAYTRFMQKHLPYADVTQSLQLRINYHEYPQSSMSLHELKEYFNSGVFDRALKAFLAKRILGTRH